ncbi:IclR family transcriptional regulator [Paenibacillus sp. NPDC057967]|uniref:IclR family transcriptional regulator n=1 Tax=Paenibacillus sp. NPDC057967 TaxID=3346293 RepID=UPI0036D7E704
MVSVKQDGEAQTNSSVERALILLELLANCKSSISLAEIVQKVELPKSTVHRILETLRLRGYVEWEPNTEKYALGLKLIEIGVTGLINIEIVDAAAPYLREISTMTGETAFLAVYNEGEIVYLYKVEGTNSIRTSAQLGSRRPLHSTGLGKAIASTFSMEELDRILEDKGMEGKTINTITDRQLFHEEMSRTRLRGWATDNEEGEIGLSCYAVPIFNYSGRVVGAISCAGPTNQVQSSKEIILSKVVESGEQISRRMGYVPSMRLRS